MKILLAEDDPEIRETLLSLLEENGFIVDACADGQEALNHGLENDYDVVLLDFGLPVFSGEQIMTRWKRAGRRFPVLAVTGTRTLREEVRELINLGIDQYFRKPVLDYSMLIDWVKARANASASGGHGTVIKRGELELDTENLITRYKGKRIELSPSQFQVLRVLALNEGPPLSCRTISNRCFDESDGSKEMQVRMHIARIREKFGFNIIVNVAAAQGYRIEV